MRPLLALIVSLLVLGTVQAYMEFVESLPEFEIEEPVETKATGVFRLELTLSQDARPDPFEPTSLLVTLPRQDGYEVLRREDVVSCTTPVVIDSLAGFQAGENELFVMVGVGDAGFGEPGEAGPGLSAAAIRVQLYRDHVILNDETLWAAPGEPIQGKVLISIPDTPSQGEAEHHDH